MPDLIGQTVGKYRIEALIGKGGMGEVYRGVHIHLNRPAAVKVMHQRVAADPDFQARFRREAQSAAALNHPNIVQVYDFGEERGLYYLVLELVSDGSLRTLMQRRAAGAPPPLNLVLDLVRQAAEGIGYAQSQRMVHRDIKPDNLLLQRQTANPPTGEAYVVKINDFGLARLTEGNTLTVAGTVLGTPSYMSPEQAQGKALDGRSDIYSLGVVLYEALTGMQPFKGANAAEVMFKQVSAPPAPPREVHPDIAPDLNAITLRCLAKKPEDRFQTGTELARALRAAISGEPLADPEPARPIVAGTPSTRSTRPSGPAAAGGPVPVPQQPSGTTPLRPPRMPPLPAGLSGPLLRIVDAGGAVVRDLPLNAGSVTIGRQPDNDVVLVGDNISRHHVCVGWDGKAATLTDLGSANGTLLASGRLLPQVAQEWRPNDTARIGNFWLLLALPGQDRERDVRPASGGLADTMRTAEPVAVSPGGFAPGPNGTLPVRSPQPVAVETPSKPPTPGRIAVALDQPALSITPGQIATCKVNVTNSGTLVDHITITLDGIPPEWIQGPEHAIQLNPGAQGAVMLTVNVARLPQNRAGTYPVTVRALSRENPGEFGVATGTWTVQPFTGGTLTLRPAQARGRGRASYQITLQNDGNLPAELQLSGEDDEQRLRYQFARPVVGVEPGRSVTVGLAVRDKRILTGNAQSPYPFVVKAQPPVGRPQSTVPGAVTSYTATGRFVNVPFLPAWAPSRAAMAAGLAIAVVVFAVGIRPNLPPPIGTKAAPTTTTTTSASPSAGAGGAATCAEVPTLSGAQPQAPVNGFNFTFPANTVGLVQKRAEAKNYLYETIALCTENANAAGVRNAFNSTLIQNGWQQTGAYPANGNPSGQCGNGACWTKPGSTPALFIRLDTVAGAGKVATYAVELAVAPYTNTASLTDPGTPEKGGFKLDPTEATNDVTLSQQVGDTAPSLTAVGNAGIAELGNTDPGTITLQQLQGLNYQATSSQTFTSGMVYAIKTTSGRFAIVVVQSGTAPTYEIAWTLYVQTF